MYTISKEQMLLTKTILERMFDLFSYDEETWNYKAWGSMNEGICDKFEVKLLLSHGINTVDMDTLSDEEIELTKSYDHTHLSSFLERIQWSVNSEWDKYSGDPSFPVSDGNPNSVPKKVYMSVELYERTMWDIRGSYGMHRREYLELLVSKVDELLITHADGVQI